MKEVIFIVFVLATAICTAQETDKKNAVMAIQKNLVATTATVAKTNNIQNTKKEVTFNNPNKQKIVVEKRVRPQNGSATLQEVQLINEPLSQGEKKTLLLQKTNAPLDVTPTVKKMKPKKH